MGTTGLYHLAIIKQAMHPAIIRQVKRLVSPRDWTLTQGMLYRPLSSGVFITIIHIVGIK